MTQTATQAAALKAIAPRDRGGPGMSEITFRIEDVAEAPEVVFLVRRTTTGSGYRETYLEIPYAMLFEVSDLLRREATR
jgi:hypothetical protein